MATISKPARSAACIAQASAGPGSLDVRPRRPRYSSRSLRGRQPASLHGAPDRCLGNADKSGRGRSGISAFPGAAPFAFARAPVRLRFTYATQTARPLQARSCGGGGKPAARPGRARTPRGAPVCFFFSNPQMRLPDPGAVHRNPHHTLDVHVTTGRAGACGLGRQGSAQPDWNPQGAAQGNGNMPRRSDLFPLPKRRSGEPLPSQAAGLARLRDRGSHGFEMNRRR